MTQAAAKSQDPRFSPSYPQRVHLKERPHLESLLRTWTERVEAIEGSAGGKSIDARTLVQLHGALDQIAEAVGRMPGEVGGLYQEDRHRLEEAVRALERIFAHIG